MKISIKERLLAESISHMLISHAAHGYALGSVDKMGEITFRDALVVAAAAVGTKIKQSWIIEREINPDSWSDGPVVDLVIFREKNKKQVLFGGTELKFWRQTDTGNASNRRKDLVKDFFRAAALSKECESFAFVSLIATQDSWKNTTNTSGKDEKVVQLLKSPDAQIWRKSQLEHCPSVKTATQEMRDKVPVSSAFSSYLLSTCEVRYEQRIKYISKVWKVRKHENTSFE